MRMVERISKAMIEAHYLMEGIFDPSIFKCVFMAGGSGSGKGYVGGRVLGGLSVHLHPTGAWSRLNPKQGSKVVLTTAHGLKVINADIALEILLTHNDLPLDMTGYTPDQEAEKEVLRKMGKEITSRHQQRYLDARLGLLIDGTASDVSKIEKVKHYAESLGYDTSMVFVNTPLAVAYKNNKGRARSVPDGTNTNLEPVKYGSHQPDSGDPTPKAMIGHVTKGGPDIVLVKWHEAQEALHHYKSLFGSNFLEVFNSGAASDDQEAIFNTAYKHIDKFLKKPVSSPVAKEWIANYFKK